MSKALIKGSGWSNSASEFIEPLSPTLNSDLSPAQAVTAFNVPLTSFNNTVIDDLQRDVYWCIYNSHPRLKEVPPMGREEVRDLLEWILSDVHFKTRTYPLCNLKLASAAAAYVITDELMQMDPIQMAMDMLEKADDREDWADDLDERADQEDEDDQDDQETPENDQDDQETPENDQDDQESDNPTPTPQQASSDEQEDDGGDGEQEEGEGSGDQEEGDEPGDNEQPTSRKQDFLRERATKQREQAQKLRDQAREQIESVTGSALKSFERAGAVKAGAEFGDDVQAFVSSWGEDKRQDIMLSPEELMQVMALLRTQDMALMSSLIGRVHGIARDVMEGRAPVEIYADEGGYTKDIMSMHPAEMFKLSPLWPAREEAIKKWITTGLGGVKKTAHAKTEGAFIGAVDQSISMKATVFYHDDMQVLRKHISKSLALGLARAARDNGQQFRLFGFSSFGDVTDIMTNETDIATMLKWGLAEIHGGTNFDYAFTTILAIAEAMDEEDREGADFLLITDGECTIDESTRDALLDEKKTYGTRIIVLLVGASPEDDIYEVADAVLSFTDLDAAADELSKLMWE